MKDNARALGKSAAALAAIGIIAKLIGALYRVPLTNIIGAEGMGLYQMVFPLYTVLLAFCGGGITSAVARVVAKYVALGDDVTARRTLRVALVPLAITAAACTVAVALLRNVISSVQGNTDAGIAYLAICPSLLFACVIGVLRGYFQGKAQALPSGISQLIEQVIKLALGLYLGKLLLPYGVKYAVAGALLGVSASELAALIYLSVRFIVMRKRRVKTVFRVAAANAEASAELAPRTANAPSDRELMKELYSFALPVTLGALVLPATQMIDSVLVINLLMHGGTGRADATALFGLFVGPVGTLINMPTVVVLSVAIAFLPALTSAVARGEDVGEKVRTAIKWIMLFVLPVTLAFLLFPDRVCSALYSRGLTAAQLDWAARLLRVQALGVLYAGVLQLCTTVLQAYNKAHRPVINLVIGACVKVALTPALVRAFGIIGASGATTACYAVAATLTARSAYKCAPIAASVKNALLLPLAFSLAGCAAFYGTVQTLSVLAPSMPTLWQSIIGAATFLLSYAAGIIGTGALDVRAAASALKKGRRASEKSEQKSDKS